MLNKRIAIVFYILYIFNSNEEFDDTIDQRYLKIHDIPIIKNVIRLNIQEFTIIAAYVTSKYYSDILGTISMYLAKKYENNDLRTLTYAIDYKNFVNQKKKLLYHNSWVCDFLHENFLLHLTTNKATSIDLLDLWCLHMYSFIKKKGSEINENNPKDCLIKDLIIEIELILDKYKIKMIAEYKYSVLNDDLSNLIFDTLAMIKICNNVWEEIKTLFLNNKYTEIMYLKPILRNIIYLTPCSMAEFFEIMIEFLLKLNLDSKFEHSKDKISIFEKKDYDNIKKIYYLLAFFLISRYKEVSKRPTPLYYNNFKIEDEVFSINLEGENKNPSEEILWNDLTIMYKNIKSLSDIVNLDHRKSINKQVTDNKQLDRSFLIREHSIEKNKMQIKKFDYHEEKKIVNILKYYKEEISKDIYFSPIGHISRSIKTYKHLEVFLKNFQTSCKQFMKLNVNYDTAALLKNLEAIKPYIELYSNLNLKKCGFIEVFKIGKCLITPLQSILKQCDVENNAILFLQKYDRIFDNDLLIMKTKEMLEQNFKSNPTMTSSREQIKIMYTEFLYYIEENKNEYKYKYNNIGITKRIICFSGLQKDDQKNYKKIYENEILRLNLISKLISKNKDYIIHFKNEYKIAFKISFHKSQKYILKFIALLITSINSNKKIRNGKQKDENIYNKESTTNEIQFNLNNFLLLFNMTFLKYCICYIKKCVNQYLSIIKHIQSNCNLSRCYGVNFSWKCQFERLEVCLGFGIFILNHFELLRSICREGFACLKLMELVKNKMTDSRYKHDLESAIRVIRSLELELELVELDIEILKFGKLNVKRPELMRRKTILQSELNEQKINKYKMTIERNEYKKKHCTSKSSRFKKLAIKIKQFENSIRPDLSKWELNKIKQDTIREMTKNNDKTIGGKKIKKTKKS